MVHMLGRGKAGPQHKEILLSPPSFLFRASEFCQKSNTS